MFYSEGKQLLMSDIISRVKLLSAWHSREDRQRLSLRNVD